MQKRTPLLLFGCAVWLAVTSGLAAADEKFIAPSLESVRDQSMAFVATQKTLPAESLTAIKELWNTLDETATSQELLDAAVQTFALADADIHVFRRCLPTQPDALAASRNESPGFAGERVRQLQPAVVLRPLSCAGPDVR